MPYITKPARLVLDSGDGFPETAGEFNYALTKLAIEYIQRHDLSYQSINDVMGAFSGAAKEFYRRVAVPYEDHKIVTNGDVYPARLTGVMDA